MKMNIKKGDKVLVIAGKDKGKEADVIRVVPEACKVVCEKVNVIKRHMRPTQQNQNGGIVSKEAPIHVSNVMLICPNCKKPTRVSRVRKDGKLIRTCKKCTKAID